MSRCLHALLDKLPRSPIELHKRPLNSVSQESGTPRELSPMSVNISRDIVSPVVDKSSDRKNVDIDHVVQHNMDASIGRNVYFARQNDELAGDDLVSSENIASVAAIVEVYCRGSKQVYYKQECHHFLR